VSTVVQPIRSLSLIILCLNINVPTVTGSAALRPAALLLAKVMEMWTREREGGRSHGEN